MSATVAGPKPKRGGIARNADEKYRGTNSSNSQKWDARRLSVLKLGGNTLKRNGNTRRLSALGARHSNRPGQTNLHIYATFNHDLRRSRSRRFLKLSVFANPTQPTFEQVDIARTRGIGRRWPDSRESFRPNPETKTSKKVREGVVGTGWIADWYPGMGDYLAHPGEEARNKRNYRSSSLPKRSDITFTLASQA